MDIRIWLEKIILNGLQETFNIPKIFDDKNGVLRCFNWCLYLFLEAMKTFEARSTKSA